jgi:ATP-dependent Clp protease protease subunit
MSTYTIPTVFTQHPRGDRVTDVYSQLLTERIVYLGTGIDAGVANALIAQLIHLESADPDGEIQLYVNCEGGDPGAMLAVYDTMRYIRPAVATTCVGQAIGPGAVLLAAGAAGRRAALPHARIVLHQADEVVRVRSDMEEVLARHTGRSVEVLRADTDRDRVLTASAAREYGIVDHVLEHR